MSDKRSEHRNRSVEGTSGSSQPNSEARAAKRTERAGKWLLDEKDDEPTKFSQSAARSSSTLRRLKELREKEKRKHDQIPWIKTGQAHAAVAAVIVVSAVLTGIDVEISVRGLDVTTGLEVTMTILQALIVIAFVVELLLNIRADGLRFLASFGGFFDSIIIAISVVELCLRLAGEHSGTVRATVALRIFRLLRLVRFIKVLLVVKELRLIFTGFFMSFAAVFWSFVLMMILIYVGTLFCVILLKDVDGPPDIEKHFGSVAKGLFTHFQVVTLEDWPGISDSVMQASGNSIWAVYFIVFILVTSLALMNLVTGVVCEKLYDASGNDDISGIDQLAAYQEDVEDFRVELGKVFSATWQQNGRKLNRYSNINYEDFSHLIELPDMRRLLERQGIVLELSDRELFEIVDADNSGDLSFNELVEAFMRLRGSQRHFHSLLLQRDIAMLHKRQVRHVDSLARDLEKTMSKDVSQTGLQLLSGLKEVDEKARLLTTKLHNQGHHGFESKRDTDSATDGFEDSHLAASVRNRFEVLLEELDRHCACASDLLTNVSGPRTKDASKSSGVSQGAQTDATIDFLQGLGPCPSDRALLAL